MEYYSTEIKILCIDLTIREPTKAQGRMCCYLYLRSLDGETDVSLIEPKRTFFKQLLKSHRIFLHGLVGNHRWSALTRLGR